MTATFAIVLLPIKFIATAVHLQGENKSLAAATRQTPTPQQQMESAAFLDLLETIFDTINRPKVLTMVPMRSAKVVLLEALVAKGVTAEKASKLKVDFAKQEHAKIQQQLKDDVASLNNERQLCNLPVPGNSNSGTYAIDSLRLSSLGFTGVHDSQPPQATVASDAKADDNDGEVSESRKRQVTMLTR